MKIIISLFLAAIISGITFIHTGIYNMAATEKHWAITENVIEWLRIRSIAVRSEDLQVPILGDSDTLKTGAVHYDAMCTECHLAPGMSATELATGLYPQAPVFHQRTPLTDEEKQLEQIKAYFWVIKNGIKMTAMPAWGLTHDDDTVWAMALFVQQLGDMSQNQYKSLTHDQHEDEHHNHDHNHRHNHSHEHNHH